MTCPRSTAPAPPRPEAVHRARNVSIAEDLGRRSRLPRASVRSESRRPLRRPYAMAESRGPANEAIVRACGGGLSGSGESAPRLLLDTGPITRCVSDGGFARQGVTAHYPNEAD
jgi:hypothetical protein